MRIKLSFVLLLLSIVLVSCNEEKEPNINHIKVIFCTPSVLTRCLPLEILKAPDGWEAKYVGSTSKERIKLEPRFSLDEFGDSIIFWDEYVGNKKNGVYLLSKETENSKVYYINLHRQDTIVFYARIISEGDIFINNKEIKQSFSKIQNHRNKNPIGSSSERRDLNFIYLLHTNPHTLTYSFKSNDKFEIITSEDSILRLYKYYCWTGGNGWGASSENITAQYKANDHVVTLDDFSYALFQRMKNFNEANFPNCSRLGMFQATLNEKKHYLIEVVYSDSCPMPFIQGHYDYYKTNDLALFAYTIEEGKLTPSNILDGSSMIELVNDDCNDEDHFKYNDRNKTLSIPVLDQRTHTFTGRYKEILLK